VKPTDAPTANPQVILHEEFDDWVLLFLPLTGEVVGIDPVGLLIWKMLDGRRTAAEIASAIAAQCKDAPPTVLDDTLAFLTDLSRRMFVSTEKTGTE